MCTEWVTRMGHNQHTKPGRPRRWRGFRCCGMQEHPLLLQLCQLCCVWQLGSEQGWLRHPQWWASSCIAPVKPLPCTGKWLWEMFSELHQHPAFAPAVCFIPEHYWGYSCPSWLYSAPQCCLVDSSPSQRGLSCCRGADTHFTPVCSSRTPRLPACSPAAWCHLCVHHVFICHYSSEKTSQFTIWLRVAYSNNRFLKITISSSASTSSCLDCTTKSLLIWWRTSLQHTSSFIFPMIRTSQCTFAISVPFKLGWAELPMQRFDLSWNPLISISFAHSFMFEALWNTGNSILS